MDPLRATYIAFARLHILHHAAEEPVYGAWLTAELARHGYRISPGSLYPMLQQLTHQGLLRCEAKIVDGKVRKYYRATPAGRRMLRQIRKKVAELAGEILPEFAGPSTRTKHAASARTRR